MAERITEPVAIAAAPVRVIRPLPTGEKVDREETIVRVGADGTNGRSVGRVDQDGPMAGNVVWVPKDVAVPVTCVVLAEVDIDAPPTGHISHLSVIMHSSHANPAPQEVN